MERPILMTVESVRGILAGAKSQTRRAINPQPQKLNAAEFKWRDGLCDQGWLEKHSSYGEPGDFLWVREPWHVGKPHDERNPKQIWDHLTEIGKGVTVLYEAGGWKDTSPAGREGLKYPDNEPMPTWAGVQRSSMFMPRWASRIMLEITDVRVERVQDITEEDARAEGCSNDEDPWWRPSYNDPDSGGSPSARKSYEYLWDMINGKRQDGIYAWAKNPWVFVVEFKRREQ